MSGLEVTLAILCVLAFFAGIAVGRLLLPDLAQQTFSADTISITNYEFASSTVSGEVTGDMIEKLYAYIFVDPPTGFDPNVPHVDAKEVARSGNTFSIPDVPQEDPTATDVFVAVWGTGCVVGTDAFSSPAPTTTTTTTTTTTSTTTSTTEPP